MKKSQIRMPLWGPYSKKYMGLSRIVDDRAAEGARYDFVVHPTLWNSATPVPNVTVPSGYHLWSCDEDFRFYSYRYELMWKDQIYADVSYTRLDEESYLMRCRFVNDTDLSQNCILNIFGALEFPAPEHCALQLPEDAALVDANDYTQYTYAKPRPWDNENPDGMHKGEFADGNFTTPTVWVTGARIIMWISWGWSLSAALPGTKWYTHCRLSDRRALPCCCAIAQ